MFNIQESQFSLVFTLALVGLSNVLKGGNCIEAGGLPHNTYAVLFFKYLKIGYMYDYIKIVKNRNESAKFRKK